MYIQVTRLSPYFFFIFFSPANIMPTPIICIYIEDGIVIFFVSFFLFRHILYINHICIHDTSNASCTHARMHACIHGAKKSKKKIIKKAGN